MNILVTGGARSGKSTFAEIKAKSISDDVLYIATAIPFDDEMKDRIKHHRERRPLNWKTLEKYKDFNELTSQECFGSSSLILLDCLTIMISNLMINSDINFDNCKIAEIEDLEKRVLIEIDYILTAVKKHNKDMIIVTNELGMGLVPAYPMGRHFRDIAGRMNQYLAGICEEVYFTVSGIPLKIKG